MTNWQTTHIRNLVTGYLNKGTLRSIRAKKNIVGIVIIKGFSFAIQFLLVPLSLNYINPTEYGVWLTLSSIIAWFALFDLGLGSGFRNLFAEAMAKQDYKLTRTYVSTTYAFLGFIMLGVSLLYFVFSFYFDWGNILNAPESMHSQLATLAIIVFGFFAFQFVFKTITVLVTADQKPAISEFMQMATQLLSLIAIYFLSLTTKGSILYLGIVMSASPAIVFIIATLVFYNGKYKFIAPAIRFVDFSYGKKLLNIGIRFLLLQLGFIGISQTNNIIIAHVCNPEEVTVFNIANRYMSISYIVFAVFITPLWSAFTEAYTLKEYAWMNGTFKKINLFAVFPVIATILLALLSNIAYRFWIGDAVTIPANTTYMMGIYMVVSIWVFLYTSILNGVSKVLLQLIVYIISTILHIPLAIFMGARFGINGVLLSASFFMAIIAFVSYLQVNKIIHKNVHSIWDK